MHVLICCLALLAVEEAKFSAWVPVPTSVTSLPASTGQKLSPADLAALAEKSPTMPFAELTVGRRAADGSLWVGSRHGLALLTPGAERWRAFHSRRWLPSDDVQDLALTAAGEVFVQTPAGIGQLAQQSTSLDAKMKEIHAALRQHHVRDGIVAKTYLKDPPDLSTARIQDSDDNDGLWTSMYVASEAFRFGATGDPAARQNARRSLEALMFLERISGIPGFVARSVLPIEDDPQRHRGEWHRSADNRWWWKGDTSSDEVVGHFFAYCAYYNIVADEKEKEEIRGYVTRIADHILENGLTYVGPPGKPTTWGDWSPDSLNQNLRRFGDRGLNSLEVLSHLKVAEFITGHARYTAKLKELIEKHSYAINTVGQKQVWPVEFINHSDDELAFLSYYPLLIYERDPRLRTIYLASVRRSFLIDRPERCPLFDLIYGASLQASEWTDPLKRPDRAYADPAEYDRDICLEWFRDVPADTIHWTVQNSHRRDIVVAGKDRFRKPRGHVVLPVSERHVMRWNGDPYVLDGGSEGRQRDDGTAILLPYWMGRYHHLLD